MRYAVIKSNLILTIIFFRNTTHYINVYSKVVVAMLDVSGPGGRRMEIAGRATLRELQRSSPRRGVAATSEDFASAA